MSSNLEEYILKNALTVAAEAGILKITVTNPYGSGYDYPVAIAMPRGARFESAPDEYVTVKLISPFNPNDRIWVLDVPGVYTVRDFRKSPDRSIRELYRIDYAQDQDMIKHVWTVTSGFIGLRPVFMATEPLEWGSDFYSHMRRDVKAPVIKEIHEGEPLSLVEIERGSYDVIYSENYATWHPRSEVVSMYFG